MINTAKRRRGRPPKKESEKAYNTSTSLRRSHITRLEVIQAETGLSRSEIIQRALEAYLEALEFPYSPEERRAFAIAEGKIAA